MVREDRTETGAERGRGHGRGWVWGQETWSKMEIQGQSDGDKVETINHRDGA